VNFFAIEDNKKSKLREEGQLSYEQNSSKKRELRND